MDKKKDKFIEYCNECDWREETIGLPYQFCPKCGHVNIGFSPIKKGKLGERKDWQFTIQKNCEEI